MAAALPAQLGKVSLPLSGFRIRSRINSKKIWDEFLVFQGASYFRAVAQNLLYGLSARGLAITRRSQVARNSLFLRISGSSSQAPRAAAIVIYALLESESTTGAYRFTVQPGVETQTDVELMLYPRAEMRVVGIAPLTSMFLFDETNRGRLDDYRPEVHDSDGLQIAAKSGEQNSGPSPTPSSFRFDFHEPAARGFRSGPAIPSTKRFSGLRRTIRAQAERLGGAQGRLGCGRLGTGRNPLGSRKQRQYRGLLAHDAALTPGHPAHFAYRITWSAEPPVPKSLGKTVATRSGASLDGKRRVFLLDFVGAGGESRRLAPRSGLVAGKISNATLMSNNALHGLRASFEIDRTMPI